MKILLIQKSETCVSNQLDIIYMTNDAQLGVSAAKGIPKITDIFQAS